MLSLVELERYRLRTRPTSVYRGCYSASAALHILSGFRYPRGRLSEYLRACHISCHLDISGHPPSRIDQISRAALSQLSG